MAAAPAAAPAPPPLPQPTAAADGTGRVAAMIAQRERELAQLRADSIAALEQQVRAAKAGGTTPACTLGHHSRASAQCARPAPTHLPLPAGGGP